MAPDSAEALDLAEFAKTASVTIMPGYLLRTNPHIRGFLDALRGMGALRRVHLSTNVASPPWPAGVPSPSSAARCW